jgi:hypothetical protein
MNLVVNTVYFSAHSGIQGEGFNRFDGSTMFVHKKDVENLKLSVYREWTAEEILQR